MNFSGLKRTILFINASSERLVLKGNNKLPEFQVKTIGCALACGLEFSILSFSVDHFFRQLNVSYTIIIVIPVILYFIVDMVYNSDLKVIRQNYYNYYPRWLFYIYAFLAILGVFYVVFVL